MREINGAVSLVLAAQGCWGRSVSKLDEDLDEFSLPLSELLAEQDARRSLEGVREDVERLLQEELKSNFNSESLPKKEDGAEESKDLSRSDEKEESEKASKSLLDLPPTLRSDEEKLEEPRLSLEALLGQVLEEDERRRQKDQPSESQSSDDSVPADSEDNNSKKQDSDDVAENKDDKLDQLPAPVAVAAKQEEPSPEAKQKVEEERPLLKRKPLRPLKSRKNKKLPVAIIVTAPELAELGAKKKYKGTLTRKRGKYYDVTEDIPEVTVEVYDGRNRRKLLEFGGKGKRLEALDDQLSDEVSDEEYVNENEEHVSTRNVNEVRSKKTKQHVHKLGESSSVIREEEEVLAPKRSTIYKIALQNDNDDDLEQHDDDLTGLSEVARRRSLETVKRHKHKYSPKSQQLKLDLEDSDGEQEKLETIERRRKKVLAHELFSREKENLNSEDSDAEELKRLVLEALEDSSKVVERDQEDSDSKRVREENSASKDENESSVLVKEREEGAGDRKLQLITVEDLDSATKELLKEVVASDSSKGSDSAAASDSNESASEKHVKNVSIEDDSASSAGSKSEDSAQSSEAKEHVENLDRDTSPALSKDVSDVSEDAHKKHVKDESDNASDVDEKENEKESAVDGSDLIDADEASERDASDASDEKSKDSVDSNHNSEASKDLAEDSKDSNKKHESSSSEHSIELAKEHSEDVSEKESDSRDVEVSADVSKDENSESANSEHVKRKHLEASSEPNHELSESQSKDSVDSDVKESLEVQDSEDESKKNSKDSVENSDNTLDHKPEATEEKSLSADVSEAQEVDNKNNEKVEEPAKSEQREESDVTHETKESASEEKQEEQEPDFKEYVVNIKPGAAEKSSVELTPSEEALAEQLREKLVESHLLEPEAKDKSVDSEKEGNVDTETVKSLESETAEVEPSEPKKVPVKVSEASVEHKKEEVPQRRWLTVSGSLAPEYIDQYGIIHQGHQAPFVHTSKKLPNYGAHRRNLDDDSDQKAVSDHIASSQKKGSKDKRTRAFIVVNDDENGYHPKDVTIELDTRDKHERTAVSDKSSLEKVKALPEASKFYNLSFVFNR